MSHSTDPNCIFCKIVAGFIPCHKIAETAEALSFLDIGPLSRGHALVIPKGHAVTLDQLSDEAVAGCATLAKKIGAAIATAMGVGGWNLLQNNGSIAGQVVPHVHFHIIPRAPGDALGFRWPAGSLDKDDAAALVKAIAGAL